MKQMKKFAALLLALAMVFALAACGGEPAENDPPAPEAETPSAAPEPTPDPTPAEPEFVQVAIGETVQLESLDAELTPNGFSRAQDKLDGYLHHYGHNENNYYFWLSCTMTNTGTSPLEEPSITNVFKVQFVFDDTYTYDGRFTMRDDIGPMATTTAYFWADIPPAMLEQYQTLTIYFGYVEGFNSDDTPSGDDFAEYDYLYEFVSA